ncbi:MAG: 4Fe-4S dicluster domain-containing protein [Elusimicrobia bacterium]|nr:4Fe-4S dicluster domain-containing protein [Elusimicrobiota bacterium]
MLQQNIKYEESRDPDFARWATEQTGGENIRRCIQCGTCSATCPVSSYMDHTPRQLIHLAREGFKKEVLSSFTLWLCASCYSCRVDCPKDIHVTDFMYALKRRAMAERVYPKRFPIPVLAQEFSRMVQWFGRVNETIVAAVMFLRTDWFKLLGQTGLGLKLMRTGRLSVFPESIRGRSELQRMLKAAEASKEKEVASR